jgi:hypothetical protein
MADKSKGLLDEVKPNRRSIVQSILGMGAYSVPSVRTVVMCSAAALSRPVTLLAVTTMPHVPEIEPDSVGPALALLGGAALLVGGRGRSKKQAEKTETDSESPDGQR